MADRRKDLLSNSSKNIDFSGSLNSKGANQKDTNELLSGSYKSHQEKSSVLGHEYNSKREKGLFENSDASRRQGNLSSILSGIDKSKAKLMGENVKMSSSGFERSYELEKEFKESNILKVYKKKIDDKKEEVNKY